MVEYLIGIDFTILIFIFLNYFSLYSKNLYLKEKYKLIENDSRPIIKINRFKFLFRFKNQFNEIFKTIFLYQIINYLLMIITVLVNCVIFRLDELSADIIPLSLVGVCVAFQIFITITTPKTFKPLK